MEKASELACRLACQAEAVCRHYLSNGRREGRYWLVGDVRNTPGRSMFVRLKGPESGKGAAGNWTDSASGEYGDLLDVIRESCKLIDFKDVADEARGFLNLPLPEHEPDRNLRSAPAQARSPEAARRLFTMSQPVIHADPANAPARRGSSRNLYQAHPFSFPVARSPIRSHRAPADPRRPCRRWRLILVLFPVFARHGRQSFAG